jgi:hypothetical protein
MTSSLNFRICPDFVQNPEFLDKIKLQGSNINPSNNTKWGISIINCAAYTLYNKTNCKQGNEIDLFMA